VGATVSMQVKTTMRYILGRRRLARTREIPSLWRKGTDCQIAKMPDCQSYIGRDGVI